MFFALDCAAVVFCADASLLKISNDAFLNPHPGPVVYISSYTPRRYTNFVIHQFCKTLKINLSNYGGIIIQSRSQWYAHRATI